MENHVINLRNMVIHAAGAEATTWQGRQALRLENGLALVPDSDMKDASISVMVGTDGPAYPGVAFRVKDEQNYECAYAVPHVSGEWDALQYDPVFNGSNTWQLYYGPAYQRATEVPTGTWFQLKVDFCGPRMVISVDGGSPLVVDRLAHSTPSGQFGLWTFRPAYFCDLRVSACEGIETPGIKARSIAKGIVEEWFLEGYGAAVCEPNGVVNLNRFIPASVGKVRLVRNFEMLEHGEVVFDFGYSDVLSLELDGSVVFSGENMFKGFASRSERGYAELGGESVRKIISKGGHCLAAELGVVEGFGWGLILSARGEGLRWIPLDSD